MNLTIYNQTTDELTLDEQVSDELTSNGQASNELTSNEQVMTAPPTESNETADHFPRLPARPQDQVPAMGEMADRIWHTLCRRGRMSISGLARELAAPRDYVMEGIGWLGREGRITVHEESRIRFVTPCRNNSR